MNKRGRRRDLMERELLNAAAELFAQKGFGGTTLRDIAKVSGVGRTTLYHYFASKDELLEALFEDQTLRSYEEVREVSLREDLTPLQKLSAAVTALALHVLEQPKRFRVVERDETSLPPDLFEQQQLTKRKVHEELIAIIESGILAGQFRRVDPHLASLTIFGMCNWPAWWFNPKGTKSANEVAEYIAQFALTALSRENDGLKDNPARLLADIRENLDLLTQMVVGEPG